MRIYCFEPQWSAEYVGSEQRLSADQAYHVCRVLRAKVGYRLSVLNGTGSIFQCVIQCIQQDVVSVSIHSVDTQDRPRQDFSLLQAVPKAKSLEMLVRQATELGVMRISLIVTRHSEVGDAVDLKRLNLIALEACKQSGNPWLPLIEAPITFEKWLLNYVPSEAVFACVGSLESGSQPIVQYTARIVQATSLLYAVGPEGDWSADELAQLRARHWVPVHLAQPILRVETAAVCGISQMMGCAMCVTPGAHGT